MRVICFSRLLLDYKRSSLGWILVDRVGRGVLKDYSLLYNHLHRDIRRNVLVLTDVGLLDLHLLLCRFLVRYYDGFIRWWLLLG